MSVSLKRFVVFPSTVRERIPNYREVTDPLSSLVLRVHGLLNRVGEGRKGVEVRLYVRRFDQNETENGDPKTRSSHNREDGLDNGGGDGGTKLPY